MVAFKDLHTDAGLKALNEHLATRSYIEGYQATAADVSLLTQINTSIDRSKYPHAARWLNHLQSFSPQIREKLAGAKGGKAAAKKKSTDEDDEEEDEEAEEVAPAASKDDDDDDDDDDFMASLSDDDEDDGAAALIAKKNAEREAAKKKEGGKAGPIAKSSLILDVKPEDSDTNMEELLEKVKEIEMDGLLWGGHEFIPVAYGIRKLRIICVVEDEKVSIDDLQEQIEATPGVQSTDIHAFNKL